MELVAAPRPRRRRPSAVLVVALVLLALSALVLLPQALGLRHDVVRDGAMGSTWHGAVVVVDDVPGSDLRVGDVISFRQPGGARPAAPGLLTRRVVRVADGVALTRADGAPARDPWRLRLDATVPRVVGRAPYVGRVVDGGPTAVAALAGVALLALLVGGLARRSRSRRGPLGAPPVGVG
jgi:hypothetical protein